MQPAPQIVAGSDYAFGHQPRALASDDQAVVAVYLPMGGKVELGLTGKDYQAQWFDPRTGEISDAVSVTAGEHSHLSFEAPAGGGERPWDWVLVLKKTIP